jgi:hypothetical protein
MLKFSNVAQRLGWKVDVNNDEYTFSKFSPAGQDFNFTVSGSAEEVVREIKERVDDFDVSAEAYIWLDESGHGANGAPYDMRDLYNDMEACREMMRELWRALSDEQGG